MSLSEQIQRVDGSQNEILKTIVKAFGVTIGSEKIDGIASLAKLAANLKENGVLSNDTKTAFGLTTDAVPDNVLSLLSKAALYKTITPTAQLGTLPEGSIIYINENGSPVPFYVAKKGYEPEYNTDRVLLVRKDVVQTGAWNSSNLNTYDNSTIDTWMNETYLKTLSSTIQSAVGQTNIPYTPMGGTTTVQRIEKAVFSLSMTELSISQSGVNTEGTSLPIASTLYPLPDGSDRQYTRSPNTTSTSFVWSLNSLGAAGSNGCSISYGYRPAFTLPTSFTAYTTEMYPSGGLYDISNNLLLKLPGAQIETGSYVGTGTYGASNPNSLTFGFEPKLLYVARISGGEAPTQQPAYSCGIIMAFALPETYSTGGGGYLYMNANDFGTYQNAFAKRSGNTVAWYNTNNDKKQLNENGSTYMYCAIG